MLLHSQRHPRLHFGESFTLMNHLTNETAECVFERETSVKTKAQKHEGVNKTNRFYW